MVEHFLQVGAKAARLYTIASLRVACCARNVHFVPSTQHYVNTRLLKPQRTKRTSPRIRSKLGTAEPLSSFIVKKLDAAHERHMKQSFIFACLAPPLSNR
jgi:hypothetical protein